MLELEEAPDPRAGIRYAIRSYFYGLSNRADAEEFFLYWHWNPVDRNWPYPHVHAPVADPLDRGMRLHVPTGGPVAIEHVLDFLLRERLVEPAHDDWSETLAGALRESEASATPGAPAS